MKLTTYLNYGGNCEAAFRFYAEHLGGKIKEIVTFAGQKLPEGAPANWDKAIMYVRMTLGETELMGNDVPPATYKPMCSVYLALAVTSIDEAERIYGLLVEGGEIFMPMQETFFAHRFGMLRDRFGTSWMIIHERPMPQGD
jgi:PhnB protein